MSTQYYVAASLDGFIADRDNSIDWLLEFGFEEFGTHYEQFLAGVGAVIMGADTYQFLLDDPAEWGYTIPAFVLTHRELPGVAGADIRFARDSIAAVHAEAETAAGGKNVWVVGGGNVAGQFADAGLLDELLVTIMPIVLGAGRPVLPLAATTRLTATGTTPFPGGAIELRYTVGAEPQAGTGV